MVLLLLMRLLARRGETKKKCLVFKVDYEKVYDLLCWDFLLYMMKRMGFYDKWVRWIAGCLKSSIVSVLVNGSPVDEFLPQRGLK